MSRVGSGRVNRVARVPAALLAGVLALAACSGAEDDTPRGTGTPGAAATTSTSAVAPADPLVRTAHISGHELRLTVRPIVRSGGGALVTGWLDLLEPAPGTKSWEIGQAFGDPFGARYSAAEVRLLDPATRRLHVAATTGNSCECSAGLDRVRLAPRKPVTLAAAFAAPPGSQVDVVWPGFGVIPDVPVQDGTPAAVQRPDGRGMQSFDLSAAASAPVVPLEEFRESLDGGVREVRSGEQQIFRLDARQLFADDGATLLPGANRVIDRVVGLLRDRPGPLDVTGYAADRGSDLRNRDVSHDRADAVAEALAAAGLRPDRFPVTVEGHGDDRPVVPPTTPAARRLNDRVEIVRPIRAAGPAPALSAPQWFGGGSSVVGIRNGAQEGVTMRVERILHRGPYVAVDLEVRAGRRRAPTVGTLLSPASGDPRGDPGPAGAYSARGVRLLGQFETMWPLDYRDGRGRACLCDRFAVDAVPPGGARRLTVLFPAPDENDPTVSVDIPVLGRLTDVPVTGL